MEKRRCGSSCWFRFRSRCSSVVLIVDLYVVLVLYCEDKRLEFRVVRGFICRVGIGLSFVRVSVDSKEAWWTRVGGVWGRG